MNKIADVLVVMREMMMKSRSLFVAFEMIFVSFQISCWFVKYVISIDDDVDDDDDVDVADDDAAHEPFPRHSPWIGWCCCQ